MNGKDIQTILQERGTRYGEFENHAKITQRMKQVAYDSVSLIHGMPISQHLTYSQQEALDMIFHKVGRILNGDPNYEDSWRDIAGYATLIADELLEKEKTHE